MEDASFHNAYSQKREIVIRKV